MIQVNELRVGNWVKYPASGQEFQVDIEGLKIAYCYEPIPLTAELLEKCGFDKVPDRENIWHKNRLAVWLGNRCLCYLREEDSLFTHYIQNDNIYNLHQLQNIYFWLTGEELIAQLSEQTVEK